MVRLFVLRLFDRLRLLAGKELLAPYASARRNRRPSYNKGLESRRPL